MQVNILCMIILVKMNMTFTLDSGKAINNNTANTARESDSESSPSKLLSRRKRFLLFPDGSSVQLVFCTQNHGYLQIGDVVWYGHTAGLAWELPSNPGAFKDRKHTSENKRRDSTNHKIVYVDKHGKFISETSYRRNPIVNPAFAKRSVKDDGFKSNKSKIKKSITKMHERMKVKDWFENLDIESIKFHVKTRNDLFEKIEKLLEGIGLNGKECVLRLLCETGKGRGEQGSFLEELLRVTFSLPRGLTFDSVNKEYDIAHGRNGDCATMYPHCRYIK
ncbi:hypothetical protein ACJJTC_017015 [Scirpophaga incertulas]